MFFKESNIYSSPPPSSLAQKPKNKGNKEKQPTTPSLLLSHLPLIKLKLPPLKNIPIAPAALPWPACDFRVKPPPDKLIVERLRKLLEVLGALLHLPKDPAASVNLDLIALRSLLDTDGPPVPALVPSLERVRVDQHNRPLHQRLSTHQLVVASVVVHVQNANLASANLGAPREVASFEALRAEFVVAAAAADRDHFFRSDLRH